MKVKTTTLSGAALAAAVAIAVGVPTSTNAELYSPINGRDAFDERNGLWRVYRSDQDAETDAEGDAHFCSYSRPAYDPERWDVAGPLIDQFNIMLDLGIDGRIAVIKRHTDRMDVFEEFVAEGETFTQAAMRCLVLSILGEEVELPAELIGA